MSERVPRIAGAGLLALDVILSDPRCADALTFAGGTCGNVLSILSLLHWTATPIGFIGDDPAGKRILADLATSGVYSNHLIQRAESSTQVFVQRLEQDEDGQPRHSFAHATACPHCGHSLGEALTPPRVGATPIKSFTALEPIDVFFMDRLSDDILSLAQSAQSHGALIFYEPSVKEDTRYWRDAFELIDIVKYSSDRFVADEIEPFIIRRADRPLWEVQTKGASGLQYRKHETHSDAIAQWTLSAAIPASRVVDTCGAGDWCSAGLIYGLLTFQSEIGPGSFENSIRLGQLLAAWACAFVGARGAMYCNDRRATWAAIKSLAQSRQLDLSRLPFAEQTKPSHSSDVSSCVARADDYN